MPQLPAVFQVRNLLTQERRRIGFEVMITRLDGQPAVDWTVELDPPRLLLRAGDGPVDVTVVLRPPPGPPTGERVYVRIEAKLGKSALGGIALFATHD